MALSRLQAQRKHRENLAKKIADLSKELDRTDAAIKKHEDMLKARGILRL
jgi:septal ring factor EnvC (AmiA/AmiB activator)